MRTCGEAIAKLRGRPDAEGIRILDVSERTSRVYKWATGEWIATIDGGSEHWCEAAERRLEEIMQEEGVSVMAVFGRFPVSKHTPRRRWADPVEIDTPLTVWLGDGYGLFGTRREELECWVQVGV